MNVFRNVDSYSSAMTIHRFAKAISSFAAAVLLSAALARSQSATAFCFGDGTDSIGNCPCGVSQNGVAGHGCDNSFATGGALMTQSGNSCILCAGGDTLVLAGSGIPPNHITVLVQSPTEISPHLFGGDGIRCVGGNLKRLFQQVSSSAGTVSFPPPGTTISTQSAAVFDPLTAGTLRHYQIFYRDPPVGFCPPGTINLSNGYHVLWR